MGDEWRSIARVMASGFSEMAKMMNTVADGGTPHNISLGGAAGGRKERKKKDPNAPKRAQSAFLFFLQEKSAEIRSRQPDRKIPIAEVASEVSAAWKSLSDSKRAKYETKANTDRARYERETAAYKAGLRN